jgi:hypothetical protein
MPPNWRAWRTTDVPRACLPLTPENLAAIEADFPPPLRKTRLPML